MHGQCSSHHWRKSPLRKGVLVEIGGGRMERHRATMRGQSRGGARGCGLVLEWSLNGLTCPEVELATLPCSSRRWSVASRSGATWFVVNRHNEQCPMCVLDSGLPEESGVSVKVTRCGPPLVHISTGGISAVRTQPRDGVGAMALSTATSSANHIAKGWRGGGVRCVIATVTFSVPPGSMHPAQMAGMRFFVGLVW